MTDEFMLVSDDEADQSLQSLVTGPVVPASTREQSQGTARGVKANVREPGEGGLSEAGLRLLRVIVEHPLRPSSEYPSLAHISPNTFQKLRPTLVERGLVRERKLESRGQRKRSALMLEPLDTARALLSACGEDSVANEVWDDAR